MKPYVLILCANLKGNIGDYAILEAMGVSLAKLHPDHEVRFLYHGNKGIDPQRIEPFTNELLVPMDNAGAPPSYRRPRWFRLMYKLGLSQSLLQKTHASLIEKTADKLLQDEAFKSTLTGATAAYFAGGAQWGRGDLHLNMFAQLVATKKVGCKVYAYPFSLTKQTVDCIGEPAFANLTQQLETPIPVRDALSHKIIETSGTEAVSTCDIVWSMADHLSTLSLSDSSNSNKVGICVTRSGGARAPQVAQLIKTIKEAGLEPTVISTCEVEDRKLIAQIEELTGIKCIAPDSWKQAVQLLSEMRFVITNRLHCIIFSSLAGTAVIPIDNRAKTKAFVIDANLPCSVQELDKVSIEDIESFKDQTPLIKERIQAFKSKCLDDLASLLPRLRAKD
ncbi:Polysaccharide pyruvyl transferase family protein WcaK [Rubritalea squalenifaciens DSM 18772]|uniref:Polysaccharide pyruvyl transferase family protein WcaK n=1 Tax=Rubritalea squalenifaciens DSM 18772 TaxID=1123071 RepID=A0A1M6EIX0_9BACT|nr:polysaccharide pyruvyl transferase family protein [Rubritalea squalenifaciens]SHI85366.1 Polysaccharide pyruvyl transferase family protein WcaK [Rubritalea squalenifaciens DSM 18772]